ncbi:hypothetical protein DNTS_016480, partial [Danionella cerebrum]
MRSVSYVQRVSLDFSGTLFPHAICLGDADNDSLNELVVGDTNGKLYIYKNDGCKPWITRACVGMNFVVAVGAEGWFHLFDISAGATSRSDSSSQLDSSTEDEQKPSYTQHIPANTKVMLISDIDRVVRAFRWEEPSDSSDLSSGQLVLLKKWLLEGQVDSLSVNPSPEGLPELMVSQPGCGYAILICSWTQDGAAAVSGEESTASQSREGPCRDVVLHLTTGRIHNKNVDHQLFALQKLDVTGDGREEVVACAWDGQTYIIDHMRMVVRFQFDENVNAFCAGCQRKDVDVGWSLDPLASDWTMSGREREGSRTPRAQDQDSDQDSKEGSPVIERRNRCGIISEPLSKSLKRSRTLSHFNNKIHVYWRVELESTEPTNLLSVLEEQPQYPNLLHSLGV